MREWTSIVCIKNNRLLMVREHDSEIYTLPGGAVEESETVIKALEREIKDEMGIDLKIDEAELPWKQFVIRGRNEGEMIRFILFRKELDGIEVKGNEIAEIVWVNPFVKKEPFRTYESITTEKLFPLLFWRGDLSG